MSAEVRVLTWAALLAKWTEFAKSAVALPENGEGGRLRRAVPALVGLQAVTQALAELSQLPEGERAVGLDRAAVLIAKYSDDLGVIWGGSVSEEVGEFVSDAEQALRLAQGLI